MSIYTYCMYVMIVLFVYIIGLGDVKLLPKRRKGVSKSKGVEKPVIGGQ